MSAHSPAKAWARALEMTAPIARNPDRTFSTVVEEIAKKSGDAPALLSDSQCLSYRELNELANRYARWALGQRLAKGQTVALFMPNRPEYLAIWLGITRVGGVVALLNTNLSGPSLARCIDIVAPKHVISAVDLMNALESALPHLSASTHIWAHGADDDRHARIDADLTRLSAASLVDAERVPVTISDRALYIYTSGTTGLPKAANISQGRLMQWSHWFAGLMNTEPSDRMYNCLPMYHSVGGVLATGALLVAGGSVIIRESFSARQFWDDVLRWDCTLFQYIGELCRYLLQSEPKPEETQHRLRLCCGNGLRPDVWNHFKSRFRIPQILEFYAATEGNVSMFNVEGKQGAIGRIPPFLAHRFPAALIKVDFERNQPVRNEQGFCIRSAPNEVGEAIGPLFADPSNIGARFEGYSNDKASEEKVLRNVFETGDAWYRTGDLMRRDSGGYFYFVDRIGDTFRWKGENVATSEVSETVCIFPGIRQANVYGVTVPGTEGRAGMAAIVADEDFDLAAFWRHLVELLPPYARPLFVRVAKDMEVTPTFKHLKKTLIQEGFDPASTVDPIYFNNPEVDAFVRVDKALYERIQAGQFRL